MVVGGAHSLCRRLLLSCTCGLRHRTMTVEVPCPIRPAEGACLQPQEKYKYMVESMMPHAGCVRDRQVQNDLQPREKDQLHTDNNNRGRSLQ